MYKLFIRDAHRISELRYIERDKTSVCIDKMLIAYKHHHAIFPTYINSTVKIINETEYCRDIGFFEFTFKITDENICDVSITEQDDRDCLKFKIILNTNTDLMLVQMKIFHCLFKHTRNHNLISDDELSEIEKIVENSYSPKLFSKSNINSFEDLFFKISQIVKITLLKNHITLKYIMMNMICRHL